MKRLKPIVIKSNKLGTNHSGKGSITPRQENSINLYFNEVKGNEYAPMSKLEEQELFPLMKAGDNAAKERFVKSNLRFVISIAKNYLGQGLTFEDVVSEGNVGLLRALEKFNPSNDVKFITYAVWWIRQSIQQSILDHGRVVRIPVNKKDNLFKLNQVISKLEQELERKPTNDEIIDEGIDFSDENIHKIYKSNISFMSLDAPMDIAGNENGTLHDILVSGPILMGHEQEERHVEIRKMLDKLPETEKRIVQMFFGVGVDKKYTLEEIGLEFSLTRERIRQIKENALRKIRDKVKVKHLLNLMQND